MPTLPTLTTYTASSAPSIAQLQATATYAKIACQSVGHCRVRMTVNQALAVNTTTPFTFGHADYDPDGMWAAGSPNKVTVQTAGFWMAEGYVVFTGGTSTNIAVGFTFTAGSNNPAGLGTVLFNPYDAVTANGASQPTALSLMSICPTKLYIGDTIQWGVCVALNSAGATALAPAAGTGQTVGTSYGGNPDAGTYLTARLLAVA